MLLSDITKCPSKLVSMNFVDNVLKQFYPKVHYLLLTIRSYHPICVFVNFLHATMGDSTQFNGEEKSVSAKNSSWSINIQSRYKIYTCRHFSVSLDLQQTEEKCLRLLKTFKKMSIDCCKKKMKLGRKYYRQYIKTSQCTS